MDAFKKIKMGKQVHLSIFLLIFLMINLGHSKEDRVEDLCERIRTANH